MDIWNFDNPHNYWEARFHTTCLRACRCTRCESSHLLTYLLLLLSMKFMVSWLAFGGLVLLLGAATATDQQEKMSHNSTTVPGFSQDQARELLFRQETVQVIVKYKNDRGKSKVEKKAKKVKTGSTKFKYVAIEVTPEDLEALRKDKDVVRVEPDYEMHALPPPEPEKEKPPKADKLRRQLAETLPWGISRVQSIVPINQNEFVPPGPYVNQIKVCVVDTGYDIGHPDLPTYGTVTGHTPPSVSGSWNVDGHSHGTHCKYDLNVSSLLYLQ